MTPDEARQRAVDAAREEIYFGVTYDDSGDNTDYEAVARAAIAAYEATLWQAIATAPRDGTIVMGWTGTRLFIGQWFDGAAGFAGVSGALIDGARGRWIGCTHWRPLPAGPGGGE